MKFINFTLTILALISSKSVLAEKNKRCGSDYGKCSEGYCCSKYGWCGKTSDYCSTGCQSKFGICDGIDNTISTDGRCGHGYGICPEGQCCSSYGWCGKGEKYCLSGCQSKFGICNESSTDNDQSVVKNFKFYNTCVKNNYWAITFEDGPTSFDNAILDLLKKKGVKATFFVIGNKESLSNKNKKIIKRIYDEGHIIGSHTSTHTDLTSLSEADIIKNVKDLEDAVEEIIKKRTAIIRTPWGSGFGSPIVIDVLKKLGYSAAVNWNIDSRDWDKTLPYEEIFNYNLTLLKKNLGKSAITLHHSCLYEDSDEKILQLIELIETEIDFMLKNGYEAVTMDKCLGVPAYKN
ncbi:glycoside hydrolase/deacetylase [Piromyces finnis]|uniref:Glycoside hydrolase/deacetylase n=1 Tax=Piromyces finnis TaxID=1754191 RepID=A0A1Y1UN57_9FUNG|nr:glycoside hydrolase/deacetylase [Piromyces finnis]|eukprot:ORX39490.1 glycoside hydrolase/deacetylase [Piromyces finnis]